MFEPIRSDPIRVLVQSSSSEHHGKAIESIRAADASASDIVHRVHVIPDGLVCSVPDNVMFRIES